MQIENSIEIRGPIGRVYELAAEVTRWPELLPHYRWVKLIRKEGRRRVVEMAAHRDGIPVRWTAVQDLVPEERRIHFTHIAGPTKGMEVEWTMTEVPGGSVSVRIWHGFDPPWPLAGPFISKYIVGWFFVHNIAGKTLATIKRIVEEGKGAGR